jgi:hypothetical protein
MIAGFVPGKKIFFNFDCKNSAPVASQDLKLQSIINKVCMKIIKKMGGAREGAGRPVDANKRVALSVKIKPELKHWLESKIKSNGNIIEELIQAEMLKEVGLK